MLAISDLTTCLHRSDLSRLDTVLIILGVNVQIPKDIAAIRDLGENAGLPEIVKWNVSDILAKAPDFAVKLPKGWLLTSKGRKRIKQYLPSKSVALYKRLTAYAL